MTNLETLTLPSTLTEIGWANLTDSCPNLRGITVAPGNPAFTTVDGVLYTADGRKLVAYPAGLSRYQDSYTIPYGTETIGREAFYSNDQIRNIVIPETVTTVENRAFGCTYALESITLPSDLTEIPRDAFGGCDTLRAIYYRGDGLTIIPSEGDAGNDWQYGGNELTQVIGNVALGEGMDNIAVNRFVISSWDEYNPVEIMNGVLVKYSGFDSTADLSGYGDITAIGCGAFEGAGVTGILFPPNLTTICGGAFNGVEFAEETRRSPKA